MVPPGHEIEYLIIPEVSIVPHPYCPSLPYSTSCYLDFLKLMSLQYNLPKKENTHEKVYNQMNFVIIEYLSFQKIICHPFPLAFALSLFQVITDLIFITIDQFRLV